MNAAVKMLDLSREEAATRSFAKALERCRALEGESDTTFAQLLAAEEQMESVGVSVDVVLRPALAAGFAEWKREHQERPEARRIAREAMFSVKA